MKRERGRETGPAKREGKGQQLVTKCKVATVWHVGRSGHTLARVELLPLSSGGRLFSAGHLGTG